nr:hypothetical protein [uncultured Gellertiella sp.]
MSRRLVFSLQIWAACLGLFAATIWFSRSNGEPWQAGLLKGALVALSPVVQRGIHSVFQHADNSRLVAAERVEKRVAQALTFILTIGLASLPFTPATGLLLPRLIRLAILVVVYSLVLVAYDLWRDRRSATH